MTIINVNGTEFCLTCEEHWTVSVLDHHMRMLIYRSGFSGVLGSIRHMLVFASRPEVIAIAEQIIEAWQKEAQDER